MLDVNSNADRPFYAEFAWAFDMLIARPVTQECTAIAKWLLERDVLPGAALLDAGCGTGRYARDLAQRGYVVDGVDLSSALIEVAKGVGRAGCGTAVSFTVGDLLTPPRDRYDAILCRGVLNDIVDDGRRRSTFAAFARALRPRGALILDVREWAASVDRKAHEPVFEKRVMTERGQLTFTSVTTLDHEQRLMLVSERHSLRVRDVEKVSAYEFVMRPWEHGELAVQLSQHGFEDVRYFGAYDPGVKVGTTDRLVAVAQLSSGRV